MPLTAAKAPRRCIGPMLVVLGSLLLPATEAGAVSVRVTIACAADYYAYCSRHPVEGPAVRQCMRANGVKLSRRCINALIDAGEVSAAEVARREAAAK